jgi:hypothetical protein
VRGIKILFEWSKFRALKLKEFLSNLHREGGKKSHEVVKES